MPSAFTRAYPTGIERPVCFGLSLKPFTLGHYFLLASFGSPVLSGQFTVGDAGIAAFICHHNAEESGRLIHKWWFKWFLRYWSACSKPHWLTDDLPRFHEYVSEGLSSPPLQPARRGEGASRVCVAPSPWVKLFFAMHVLGMSRSDAMRTPVAELNALYATWAEWSGSGELVDEDRRDEFLEFASQEDAKRFNPDGSPKPMEAG